MLQSPNVLHVQRSKRGSSTPLEILNRVARSDADKLILDYLEALGSPRALTVWLLYRDGSHRDLVELTIDPLQYNDPENFRVDWAATKFLSKCVGLNTGIDLEEVAIASAEEAELRCRETNERLRSQRLVGDVSHPYGPEFFRASRLIAEILGPLPASFEDTGWSAGRSSSAFGDKVASMYKYTSRPDVTWSAQRDALHLLRDSPHWGAAVLNADAPASVLHSALCIVRGNTMITVPKSAKTDRVICYEPHMNIRLQLSVGKYIRKRLSKRGVRLDDQSVNQQRAITGSITGDLATIDLSMASDTLASELVYELLPIDWALKLNDLRSKCTLWPDGSMRTNEKFSSMGNGFTFELESLIFYALASAVTGNVSVYGDDIIIPNHEFERVSDLLLFAGFAVNKRKSFATSYFRESCGTDAFCGVVCTPVYLRRLPKTTEDVVKLHNAVRAFCSRWVDPNSNSFSLWTEDITVVKDSRAWNILLRKWRHIHTCLHGPSGYGDGHYHVDFDEFRPQRAPHGLDGWWFKTYTQVSRVNRLYGDRVLGRYSNEFRFASLCVALGPKAARSVFGASVDRRQWKYKRCKVLANFIWPTIVWG